MRGIEQKLIAYSMAKAWAKVTGEYSRCYM